jgi:hypothetical protein
VIVWERNDRPHSHGQSREQFEVASLPRNNHNSRSLQTVRIACRIAFAMLDNHRGKRQDKLPDMDLCHAETRVPSSSSCRCVIFPRATYPTCRELGVCSLQGVIANGPEWTDATQSHPSSTLSPSHNLSTMWMLAVLEPDLDYRYFSTPRRMIRHETQVPTDLLLTLCLSGHGFAESLCSSADCR